MSHANFVLVTADLSAADPTALAVRLLDAHGPIELIANNVGVNHRRTFLQERDDEQLVRSFRANLHSPAFLTKRLVEALIAAGLPGSVLFVSSLHDHHVRLHPSYSVAKAGVAMLVKEMAYELAPHRIRVNAVSPGWVETAGPGEERIPEQEAAKLIPAGRFGEPDDVARIALTLLDDAWSGYVTGANIPVDGGLALHNWLMDV
ncbi:SDR family oxidoreductase [Microtetraspora sp. NBRC 13810]|uniref:SDR family NAD(P)-dependent oxidoreductase n=1 Tax=Microtetraspora sp. NBRC 13810 TaxID=3030990 RepID=UPI0025557071|nr:SDR family oxidoreductase [Microtetraspora sp. NBRC 13810]